MKKLFHDFRALIYCLCELAVGILILIDPMAFTSAIIRIAGIILIIIGVFSIIRYFRLAPEMGSLSMELTKGFIRLIGGAFCVFNPEWFTKTFPLIAVAYGIVILVVGLIKLQWSVDLLRLGIRYWFITGLGGVSSIILALVIILNPFESVNVMWIFVGVALIAEAVVDAVYAVMESKSHAYVDNSDNDEATVEFTDAD